MSVLVITGVIVVFLSTVWFLFKRQHEQIYGESNLDGPFALPFFGNLLSVLGRPFYEYEAANYKKFGKTWVDYMFAKKGCFVTADPQLAKRILVKDFAHFQHRVVPGFLPKYMRKALNFMQDDWKRVRALITVVFTSSRLRLMYENRFDLPIDTCIRNIDEIIDVGRGGNVEVRKLMRGFSLDIIASVVFSLKTNAYKDDEFSKRVSQLLARNLTLATLAVVFPRKLTKFFDISIFDTKRIDYIAQSLRLMEERKKGSEVYNDFIDLLLKCESEAETIEESTDADGHLVRKLTTEEIVGSTLNFFLGGIDTVSNAMMHLLLELSRHPEIQEKLHADLVECFPNDRVPYDEINKSEYLNAVVDESLRLHVSQYRLLRTAVDDCDLGIFKCKKGQIVGVSVLNIHRNPEYFGANPDQFRPERFLNDEVKTDFMHFMPFGAGPRSCIASRFASLELKSCLIALIKRFRFSPNENTMKYRYVNAIPVNHIDENGLRLKIERR